jgi:hypothetical protein
MYKCIIKNLQRVFESEKIGHFPNNIYTTVFRVKRLNNRTVRLFNRLTRKTEATAKNDEIMHADTRYCTL